MVVGYWIVAGLLGAVLSLRRREEDRSEPGAARADDGVGRHRADAGGPAHRRRRDPRGSRADSAAATGIAPALAIAAAAGFVVLQVLAAGLHLGAARRGQGPEWGADRLAAVAVWLATAF